MLQDLWLSTLPGKQQGLPHYFFILWFSNLLLTWIHSPGSPLTSPSDEEYKSKTLPSQHYSPFLPSHRRGHVRGRGAAHTPSAESGLDCPHACTHQASFTHLAPPHGGECLLHLQKGEWGWALLHKRKKSMHRFNKSPVIFHWCQGRDLFSVTS